MYDRLFIFCPVLEQAVYQKIISLGVGCKRNSQKPKILGGDLGLYIKGIDIRNLSEVNENDLVAMMVGREIGDQYGQATDRFAGDEYFKVELAKYEGLAEMDFITIYETDKSQATYSED